MSVVTFAKLGRMGRLCNGGFQVASTIGVARRNGFDFGFPVWRNHDGLNFESGIDIDVYKYFVNQLPRYEGPELPERFIHWGFHDVVLKQSASLYGHMQSSRYFQHCIDEVRFYFRMVDEPPQNDYVAIHYRATDYSTEIGYHPRMPIKYYDAAMDRIGRDKKFLIFSDDVNAAKELFGGSFEYACGNYLEDFRLLKQCMSFIIANSSFSALAAILGDHPEKQVIAPRPWFGPAAGITGEDIYEPAWTVVDWQR